MSPKDFIFKCALFLRPIRKSNKVRVAYMAALLCCLFLFEEGGSAARAKIYLNGRLRGLERYIRSRVTDQADFSFSNRNVKNQPKAF